MPKVMLVHAGIHWIFLEKSDSTLALPCQNKKTLNAVRIWALEILSAHRTLQPIVPRKLPKVWVLYTH